ncbi:MAG: hypothetical protein AB1608_02040 [Thermoproteota archaeon]
MIGKIAGIMALLLFSNMYAALGYVAPTSQEQDLFNKLRAEFEKLTVSKKDVTDTLNSFSDPIVISFPCDAGSLYTNVDATIRTKLARFDSSLAHTENTITGGIYVWKCNITISGGKMTMNCDNEYMLNSDALLKSSEKNPDVKLVEDLVIFYHELLHGQLMIEAIKSNESWRDDTCNKPIDGDVDYSYTDADHQIITPLQTQFASQLIEDIGGVFKVEEISPSETASGTFSKKVGSLYDYPEYIKSGISISARSYNIANIEITSQKNDIIISGTLDDKTRNGIVWLYIFGKAVPQQSPSQQTQDRQTQDGQTQTEQSATESVLIPSWIKNNARWWAQGTIGDADFIQGIKYLIENNVMVIPQTSQGASSSQDIPYWIKSNARWWADGMISDSDFVLGIQYLIKNGIMQVGSVKPQMTTESTPKDLGFVKVNGQRFEKQAHQSTQVQITGKIEDFKTGTYVYLTIIRPDQSSVELKGILTSKGEFTVPFMIDSNSPTGRYTIVGKHNNEEFGLTHFMVE